MDYITLYLIIATVFLLFINSLLVVSNMDVSTNLDIDTDSTTNLDTTTTTTELPTSSFSGVAPEKKVTELKASNGTEQKQISSLSIGTNSAAILGTTLFLLVNFEIAITSNMEISLSSTFSSFSYGYGEATAPVSVLADTLFGQASTSYKYFSKLLLLLTFIVVISVKPYILKETGLLVLLSTAGILLMASSTNFISFYLALELISLASYILVSTTITTESTEFQNKTTLQTKDTPHTKNILVYATNSIVAGLNYFLLSALSSGLLVLGISIIYYTTGELDFNSLARIFSSNSSYVDTTIINGDAYLPQSVANDLPQPSVGSGIGMCLVMTFVLFKLGASPFHYWVADVYEKVSIFVNYFLIVVAKLAMLFALMKLSFGMNLPLVENLLIVASVSSLLIGSFAGLVQTKLRRLMAFSSINHVGYILLAYSFSLTKKAIFGVSECEMQQGELLGLDQGSMIITEFSKISIASLWLYVTIYSLSTVSFFAILSLAVENGKHDQDPTECSHNLSTNLTLQRLNTFAILNIKATSNPQGPSPIFITASLTITLLSLAGVPPLAGFVAKVAIFWQVLDSGNWFLATVAVLCSVIAAIYYLRIVALLYFYAAYPDTKTNKYGSHPLTVGVDHGTPGGAPFSTESAGNGAAANQLTKFSPSSVTFLTALIISTITIILVVFPILNPSFMVLYMING
ncbi:MAG: hypothetical protein EOP34_01005 [Rickettsiales bacterium]|nr:MAG: hypothetical protein EOP34_01005 [Rickettsiales bacterium]